MASALQPEDDTAGELLPPLQLLQENEPVIVLLANIQHTPSLRCEIFD